MTQKEEVEEVPTQAQGDLGPMISEINSKVMQHTEKISRLETQNENIFSKLDSMENKVDSLGQKIDDGNERNEKIFNQLLEHHLGIKKSNNTNAWKITGIALGGGGVITVVGVTLIQMI